ncbi:MAG: putative toxin-antitoxin system toxin component, PIN family [Desulfobacterium sp.]|nr:putative toxin-antitoxin system toxin component, PIN family [Desulfobacterium sp.]
MRVLLDTNVLASATATRGLCADVLREVLTEHELVICPQIITELRRILKGKFGIPTDIINDFIWLIQQDAIHASSKHLPDVKLKDLDDLGILAAAQDGGAKILVTGDKELQELGEISGIRILSPRQFWCALTSRKETDGDA